jgi:putative colanic acid biosynthesis UDP-glucose lipid carrier transferase
MKFQYRDPLSILKSTIYLLDMVVIVLAAYIAHYMKFDTFSLQTGYVISVVMASLVHFFVSAKVYQVWRGGGILSIYKRVLVSWIIVVNVIFTLLVITKTAGDFSRVWFFYWSSLAIIQFFLYRFYLFKGLAYIGIDGIAHKRILIVGRNKVQQEIVRRAAVSNWTGYSLFGILDLDDIDRIEKILNSTKLDEVWVCASFESNDSVQKVISMFRLSTATIRLIPDTSGISLLNGGQTSILGLPALDISVSHMSGMNLIVKWLEDKCLSVAIVILISPVLLAIAVAIKLTSEGPVIFKQKRHGWNGKIITVYKFRTMKNVAQNNVVTQATLNDSRITPLGAFLRKSSLDELPQFFNVLLGDMSIVGPRPHAIQHNDDYMQRINSYMLRHKVKPGITGWAQINGHRGETEVDSKMIARVEADLYYIENWSLWLDISIVLKTVFVGFKHQNAY